MQPEIFIAGPQVSSGYDAAVFVTVRMSGDPTRLSTELLSIAHGIDRRATLDQVMTMDGRILKSLSRSRLYAMLFGGFAGFAALIAMIGLFAGLSYGVAQRTREISVRAALGATPANIVSLVLSQGLVITVTGLVVGITAALFGSRLLSTYLFGVTTHDPATYATVIGAIFVIATVACVLPARRAARIDPLTGMKA